MLNRRLVWADIELFENWWASRNGIPLRAASLESGWGELFRLIQASSMARVMVAGLVFSLEARIFVASSVMYWIEDRAAVDLG